MFRFNEDIAHRLRKLRETSGLSQSEVAKIIGMSPKYGHSYIARLENNQIKNPFFATILNYLSAVGVNWITFITELSKEQDRCQHLKVMSSVQLPSDQKQQAKLDRDTLLYETKIKPPQNFYTKLDMNFVRRKIEQKVREYCHTMQIKPELVAHYLNFAHEISTADKLEPIYRKYLMSGVSRAYLGQVRKIATRTYRAEQKKMQKQEPIKMEKVRAMAEKYLKSRIEFHPIESSVSNLLFENQLGNHVLYNSYMNFARVCFKHARKYYHKDQLLLKQQFNDTTKAWLESGLNTEIMGKIKEVILKLFVEENNKEKIQ